MVLHASAPAHGVRERLDATRIAGISGTLLFNACALALMLIPLSRVDVGRLMPQEKPDDLLVVQHVKPPEPTPAPPVPLPVTPPRAVPTPRATPVAPVPTHPVAIAPATDVSPVVDPLPSDTLPATSDGATTATPVSDGAPQSGWLATRDAPAPKYPRDSLLAGHQGTVVLRVEVDAAGRAASVTIERGSGHRLLDAAARRQVLQWTFQPAMRDGRAVAAVGLVPVQFSLE